MSHNLAQHFCVSWHAASCGFASCCVAYGQSSRYENCYAACNDISHCLFAKLNDFEWVRFLPLHLKKQALPISLLSKLFISVLALVTDNLETPIQLLKNTTSGMHCMASHWYGHWLFFIFANTKINHQAIIGCSIHLDSHVCALQVMPWWNICCIAENSARWWVAIALGCCFVAHAPEHALHEKGLQRQIIVFPLVSSQDRRAAVVPFTPGHALHEWVYWDG